MLLSLPQLIQKYQMNIRGVIQIGAHFGQEYEIYKSVGINNIALIEPAQKAFDVLVKKFSLKEDQDPDVDMRLYNCACADYDGVAEMFVESHNQGMSSSLLEPARHLQQYPTIVFDQPKEKVAVRMLDSIELDLSLYNLLNMDVQCAEMMVLKGGTKTLASIDYIISEVNNVGAELYKGCTDIREMDEFLDLHGFVRPETVSWIGGTWSDSFWIRKTFVTL